MLIDKIRGFCWQIYLRAGGARVGKNFQVRSPLDILLRDGATYNAISIGDDVSFGGKVYFRIRKNGRVIVGSNVRIGTEVWLVAANSANVVVGDHSAIGSYGIFNGGHGIQIGANCLIAGFVYLNSSNHKMSRRELIRTQGHTGRPIVIGEDVWVGGHVSITSGVCVGDGAVLGVGSVVTKDVPSYAIVVGVPARVVKYRE